MRIDLTTPFAEKDAAKALGARWDAARRVWYVTDVTDLTPFARWLPDPVRPSQATPGGAATRSARSRGPAQPETGGGTVTASVTVVVHCGCAVLPWEPCLHGG